MLKDLLLPKMSAPQIRKDSVRRERLLERIPKANECGLILVSAPAGYGKTTFLSHWFQACALPAAWLSLDTDDNQATRFWSYLITALRRVDFDSERKGWGEEFGQSVFSMLETHVASGSGPPRPEALVSKLINEIEESHANQIWLVLDDYHLIHNEAIHQSISFLLNHRPQPLHLVIGTRRDPPIQLARMRACAQITEVRHDALRFTEDEARKFLNNCMQLDLGDTEIRCLVDSTEGWIAGLQLAAVSIQSHRDSTGVIQKLSGEWETITGYLKAEVFDKQPEELQDFLLHTSIVDRLCGPLCDYLTGSNDSHHVLQQMRSANVFIETLDERLHWYRYHRLFAESLRQRLENEKSKPIPRVAPPCRPLVRIGGPQNRSAGFARLCHRTHTGRQRFSARFGAA